MSIDTASLGASSFDPRLSVGHSSDSIEGLRGHSAEETSTAAAEQTKSAKKTKAWASVLPSFGKKEADAEHSELESLTHKKVSILSSAKAKIGEAMASPLGQKAEKWTPLALSALGLAASIAALAPSAGGSIVGVIVFGIATAHFADKMIKEGNGNKKVDFMNKPIQWDGLRSVSPEEHRARAEMRAAIRAATTPPPPELSLPAGAEAGVGGAAIDSPTSAEKTKSHEDSSTKTEKKDDDTSLSLSSSDTSLDKPKGKETAAETLSFGAIGAHLQKTSEETEEKETEKTLELDEDFSLELDLRANNSSASDEADMADSDSWSIEDDLSITSDKDVVKDQIEGVI